MYKHTKGSRCMKKLEYRRLGSLNKSPKKLSKEEWKVQQKLRRAAIEALRKENKEWHRKESLEYM
jgi:uncharacterized protein YnzC (UPF0291/DUF896 family)